MGTQVQRMETKHRDEVMKAHLYILNNSDEVIPYLDEHKSILRNENRKMNDKAFMIKHNNAFLS